MSTRSPNVKGLWRPSRGISFAPSPAKPWPGPLATSRSLSTTIATTPALEVQLELEEAAHDTGQDDAASGETWHDAASQVSSRSSSADSFVSTETSPDVADEDVNVPEPPPEEAIAEDVNVAEPPPAEATPDDANLAEPPPAEVTPDDANLAEPPPAEATPDDASVVEPPPPATTLEESIPSGLPYSALEWKVSEELFFAAKNAAPGSKESFWTYNLYRGPAGEDGREQKIKIHYCRSLRSTERICHRYFLDQEILGFDLEWAPNAKYQDGIRKNVSLIQLASPSRIGLFHVALFPDTSFVAPTFKKIMEDSNIKKAGVWILGDATKLRNNLGIESKGLMELSHLYKLVKHSRSGEFDKIDRRFIPLSTQAEQFLHLPLFKGDVRASDWSKTLDLDQITYSASDAYAGLQLYAALDHHRGQIDPCPPRPYFAELKLPIRLTDDTTLETKEDAVAEPDDVDEGEVATSELTPAARKRLLLVHLKMAKNPSKPRPCVEQAEGEPSKAAAGRAKAASTQSATGPELPRDQRVEAADVWAAAYKAEHHAAERSAGQAQLSELRAYHVWNSNPDLDVAAVAALLRNPPLQTSTVANYIFSAVRKERLSFEPARWAVDILPSVNDKMRRVSRRILLA